MTTNEISPESADAELQVVYAMIDAGQRVGLQQYLRRRSWGTSILAKTEDMVQEVLLRSWGALLDGRFPAVSVEDCNDPEIAIQIRMWLYATARHVRSEYARAASRQDRLDRLGARAESDFSAQPCETTPNLRDAIEKCPPEEKAVLILQSEGCSVTEMAACLDIHRSTVSRRRDSGLRRLQQIMGARPTAKSSDDSD